MNKISEIIFAIVVIGIAVACDLILFVEMRK